MGFTSVIVGTTIFGNKAVTWGTFESDGDTGGDIDTGLRICDHIDLTVKKSAAVAAAPTNEETMPIAGSAITVDIGADEDGYWWAFGDIYEG